MPDPSTPTAAAPTVPTGQRSSAGGAAAAGGANFEARVAAWYAVQMLGEAGATAVPGHPSDVHVTNVRCQTGESVDDILVAYSNGAYDFVQAKRELDLGTSKDSDLASALDQCTRQFLSSRDGNYERPWDRPLDPERDRLVLAVGPASSGAIRDDLSNVLDRIRDLLPAQPLSDAARNENSEMLESVFAESAASKPKSVMRQRTCARSLDSKGAERERDEVTKEGDVEIAVNFANSASLRFDSVASPATLRAFSVCGNTLMTFSPIGIQDGLT